MNHTVTIEGFAFSPNRIEISEGDTVEWLNKDGINHSAKRDDDPAFDTGLLSRDETSDAISFDEVGEFGYYCQPHPHMTGTVAVKA